MLTVGTAPVALAAAKQRTVLALLVTRRNAAVRMDRIVDELWPDESPGSAVANVRTYVSGLRRALGPERHRLVTGAESYTLRLDDDQVDVAVFERAVRRARQACAAGALTDGLDHYRHALRLWRGEPFQDVSAGPRLRPYATALIESWGAANEQYRQTQFLCGDTDGAVDGLRRLVTDYPARESAWAALVRMLYAAGDRAAALATYRLARDSIVAHLGLDPGPELTAAHRDVLAGAPSTPSASSAPTADSSARCAVPRQLPPAPAVLVGRETELAAAVAALTSGGCVNVHGLGGTGKSALAVTAAHRLAARYPDGQLYVDLQGATPGVRPRTADEVLARFLRALGVAEERIGPDLDENTASFRTVTARTRVLLLLDNAVDPAQVRPLLPADPGCGVLITSRRPLSTLDSAVSLPLRELSDAAAVDLLSRLAGPDRIESHPATAAEVARLCGRLPLALRIIGARLARSPGWTLHNAAERLRDARSRLDELDLADLDVRSTFEVGYRTLVDSGGPGARLFRLLGVVGFAEFTPTEAAALIDVPGHVVHRVLDTLVDHGLVEESGADYRIHDLLRLLAGELADRHETAETITAAACRVADGYLRIILTSSVLRRVQDDDQQTMTDQGETRPVPTTPVEAAEWFVRHLPPLTTLVTRLAGDPATVDLAYDLVRPLHRSVGVSQPAEAVRLYLPVLAGAERADRPDLAAPALCSLANCYSAMYRFIAAAECADRARALLPRLADERLRARVLAVSAQACRQVGDPALAAKLAADAVALYTKHGRWLAVSICLGIAGRAECGLEHYAESWRMHRRALWLNRRFGDREDRAQMLENLATLYLRMGRPGSAARYATASLRIADEVGHAHLQDVSLQTRALARQAQGRVAEAIADAERAVRVVGRLGSDRAEVEPLRTLGVVLWLAGDPRSAEVLARADRLAETPSRD